MPNRSFALQAMKMSQYAAPRDFLRRHLIKTPYSYVAGALPTYARMLFPSILLDLPLDLIVIFTIGDFPENMLCSRYYDPQSPWYNVFYGAYGILSHKADGSYWGYDQKDRRKDEEIIKIAELDYTRLTAGQLGCPRDIQRFEVLEKRGGKIGCWDWIEVTAIVSSGLHRLVDSVSPDSLYYGMFGFPDARLLGKRESYKPVEMKGKVFFRKIVCGDDRITLAWGGMCPATPDGQNLMRGIINQMGANYLWEGNGDE